MGDKKDSDEKPMKLKRKKTIHCKATKETRGLTCVIHYPNQKSDTKVRPLSRQSYDKIVQTAKVRQSQSKPTERLDSICSQIPKSHCNLIHGIHRWCYKNFINISRLLKRQQPSQDDEETCCTANLSKRQKTSASSTSAILFAADECCLCMKGRAKKRQQEEALVKCQTKTAEKSIKDAAEAKGWEDILLRVRDVDLVAREAHYHPSCRKNLTSKSTQERHNKETDAETSAEQNAHKEAFNYIAQYVSESIIENYNVERISMLKEKYLQYMLESHPQFYNANYKTSKLKAKLINHFGSKIQFWQPNYKSELVYYSGVAKGQAVEVAFETAASESKRLEEAALLLRRIVQSEHRESSEMPWPPPTHFLMSNSIKPPSNLLDFLSKLITWRPEEASPKKERLVWSIAQDICHAITGGQWMMPKHLLLGMTLRHLTGSAELITLINRFGHCASYSRLLELETAMCKEVKERNSILPTTIHPETNIVTHLCWDNFDLQEETPSGSGTTHTAHGIIIQEVSSKSTVEDSASNEVGFNQHSKERSIAFQPEDIEPTFIKGKAEPKLTLSTIKAPNTSAQKKAEVSDMLWIACRVLPQYGYVPNQTVPSWAGWVSLTGGRPDDNSQSTVDYLPPVFAPVTENATVQHILKLSQEVSKEVGQQYTIVTFDLAVAKKAYALLWEEPQIFNDVIVRMGSFHLTCAYMCALGKSLRGSGFEEILVESGICASGSIERVMNGKHYNRAIRVHKLVVEALERLLLQAYDLSVGSQMSEGAKSMLINLATDPSEVNMSEALTNESCMALISGIQEFKGKIRQGDLGKTPQFWLNYMDRVWMILQYQRATKLNDLDLHLSSLQSMCPLFFSYDHPNYARYTTVYLLTLLNLSESHPGVDDLLKKNGFSVSRSEVPGCRNAVDITIEQTINRHAKSQGGIIGFSRNYSAYYRWCMTRHIRSSYKEATFEIADMDTQESMSHKELKSSRVNQSEEDTCKVVNAVGNFINPFDVQDKDVLYCLSSGSPAPDDIENDLLHADEIGKEAYNTFVSQRLVDDTVRFHDPIKKCKLKTFATMAKSCKVTGKSKKTKQVKAERNVFAQLMLLTMNHDISIQKALCYPLGPISWPLATADGVPAKTEKVKLMHALEGDSSSTERPTGATSYVIDGMALLQAQMALPTTFGDLAESLFSQLPKVDRVDFVTDSYFPLSIKGIERSRRGKPKAHMIKGPMTKVPRDWKSFLSCDANKQRLSGFLLAEWKKDKYAPKLLGREIFFVCEGKCVCLRSSNGLVVDTEDIDELSSAQQEEADTKIILHCLHIAAHTLDKSHIIVRSPDTDVFILLLHHMQDSRQTVLFDTGVGNKRRLIDIHRVVRDVGSEMCHALPALHAFSGCDTTSAFVRKGKLTHLKVLKQHQEYMDIFLSLGRSPEVEDHIYDSVSGYVCCLYSIRSDVTDINDLRYSKFLEQCDISTGELLSSFEDVDMSIIPPCRDGLNAHVKRANYQALIWYTADKAAPNIPQPNGHGWNIKDGKLEYLWTENNLMPQELIDILVEEEEPEDQDEREDVEENYENDNLRDIVYDWEG